MINRWKGMITIVKIAAAAVVMEITLHLCKHIQEKRIKTKNRTILQDNSNI